VGLEELNVERDILDFGLIRKPTENEEPIDYSISITHWNSTQLLLQINFSDPLMVSQSFSED